MNNIPWMENFYLADLAAKDLASNRPKDWSGIEPKTRTILRQNGVNALRYLWKTGDAGKRITVAARVNVWLNRHDQNVMASIEARERKRETDALAKRPVRKYRRIK